MPRCRPWIRLCRKNGRAMDKMVRVNFPGLFSERLPSGNIRWRVRKAGDPTVKTTLRVAPGHPRFGEHYHAARAGIQIDAEPDAPKAIKGSVGWLADLYIDAMKEMQAAGQLHAVTVQQRTVFIERLRADAGEYSAAMPQAELIKRRDKMMDTPGAADNFVKSVRAMYAWGIDRGHVKANPATGIGKINRGTGATHPHRAAAADRHPFAGCHPSRRLPADGPRAAVRVEGQLLAPLCQVVPSGRA